MKSSHGEIMTLQQRDLEALQKALNKVFSWVDRASGMPAFITGFCFIDCLATYYFARDGNPDDYKTFVKRFFPGEYDAEALYHQVRCGLVHNFTEKSGKNRPGHDFREDRPRDHLKLKSVKGEKKRRLRVINLSNFKDELKKALAELLEILNNNPELARRAIERYKKVGLIRADIETE